ncbi:hypothetical protein Goarm_000750 [Gossypium armourianum]|uniref:DUF4283 domain-containing protein n=1 Tax=Gossypium armourianum TaxID=34283 RepID=A0A7J9KAX4_9ROSI|nr:hypothetical protein [Gossypium armourianum]
METDITNLNLEDKEEEPIPCEKYSRKEDDEHRLCLVGKTLIDCVVHFPSLKRTLVDLWHPLGGVIISDLGGNGSYFDFLQGGYKEGDGWHVVVIQQESYSFSLVDGLARQLGDFIRQFIQYDAVLISRGERRYMRFRVKIDVRLALKRKKKLALGQGRKLGYREDLCPVRKTIMIQEVLDGTHHYEHRQGMRCSLKANG